MTWSPIHKGISITLAIACLMFVGFAIGFVSCLRLRAVSSNALLERQLLRAGDATPEVRAGVLQSLRSFQDGYVRRDPANLDSFMNAVFPRDEDILILGTEAGASEWVRGYSGAASFIRRDWQQWGDFRFDVDHADVWSTGDVAWVATVGSVKSNMMERPIRFTAILTRNGNRWVFRQLQFQLDQVNPVATDVFKPHTYFRLVRLALNQGFPS